MDNIDRILLFLIGVCVMLMSIVTLANPDGYYMESHTKGSLEPSTEGSANLSVRILTNQLNCSVSRAYTHYRRY